MFKPLSLFIGTRYTNLKKRDHFITFISLVSMIGIALGVMVLITVLSVMNGFTKEIRSRILSITPHVLVNAWAGENIDNWQAVSQVALRHPKVEAASPYIDGQGMLTRGQQVRGVMIKGVNPDDIDGVFPLKSTITQGSAEGIQAGSYGVVLGSQLAQNLGVVVGDTVTLVVPEVAVTIAGVAPRLKRLNVVGIFDVGYIYDSGYAFIHIDDASKIFKTQGGVTGVQLKVDDPFDTPAITRELAKQYPNDYYLVDWTILNSTYFSAVKMEKTMMFFTLMLILAVAAFNLISTLVMVVTDKKGDIAILRALGASRQKVMAIFIAQGSVIGITGTLIGVILGIVLSLNVTRIVSFIESVFKVQFLAQDIYFISFLPSDLHWQDVTVIGLSALALSLLATIHPAWRASNINPAEALRYEHE